MTVNSRGSLPASVRIAHAKAHQGASNPSDEPGTTAAGSALADLAGGLRGFLTAVDVEVRAVSELSDRIDAAVADLNALRNEQAKRLLGLDELQGVADDASLTAFLSKAIKPRKTRVAEVVPERLQ